MALALFAAFAVGLGTWSIWALNREAVDSALHTEEVKDSKILRVF